MKKLVIGFGLLLLSLFIFGLIFYGNIIAVFLLIPRIIDRLEPLGMNKYFSLIIAIPLAVLISMSIGKIISFNKDKRLQGSLIAVGVVVTLALLLGISTRNYRFDPHDGSSQQSFSWDVNGNVKILPKNMKFDPETGIKTMPLMPNVAQGSNLSKEGAPLFAPLHVSKNSRFFAPDGSSLFYYYEYPDGKIEFFSHGGHHPRSGVPLVPVDTEIMKKFNDYLSSGKESLIIGYSRDANGVYSNTSSDSPNQETMTSGGLRKMSDFYKHY